MEHARARQPVDLEQRFADLRLDLGEQVGDVAADHLPHEVVDGRVGDRRRRDVRAVAHDRDDVAEIEDLVEPVRDEQERAALVAKAPRDGEQPVDLDARQRGRRLIHDQHASVERDRLRDLDDLLVGDREALGRTVGIDAHAEPEEERLHLTAHRPAVDPAEASDGLPAHEDVLRDRQVGEERGLLVDDGDARLLRLGGRREVDVLAVEAELARVAAVEPGDDLHERGLARAVLADEGVDRAGIEAQAAGAQCDDGAERLDDPGQLEHRGCGCRRRGGHVRSSSLR